MSRGGTYAYAYDNIGNRVTSWEGSAASAEAYTVNNLNQYTAITGRQERLLRLPMTPTVTRQRFKHPWGNGKSLIMP